MAIFHQNMVEKHPLYRLNYASRKGLLFRQKPPRNRAPETAQLVSKKVARVGRWMGPTERRSLAGKRTQNVVRFGAGDDGPDGRSHES